MTARFDTLAAQSVGARVGRGAVRPMATARAVGPIGAEGGNRGSDEGLATLADVGQSEGGAPTRTAPAIIAARQSPGSTAVSGTSERETPQPTATVAPARAWRPSQVESAGQPPPAQQRRSADSARAAIPSAPPSEVIEAGPPRRRSSGAVDTMPPSSAHASGRSRDHLEPVRAPTDVLPAATVRRRVVDLSPRRPGQSAIEGDDRGQAAAAPIVNVSIGRVEVRVAAPAPPRPRATSAVRRLSLDDFLDRRGTYGGRP